MSKSQKVDSIQGAIVHEYDGIEEADNQLPTWWLWTLFSAIAFSIGYWFYYEEFEAGPSLAESYYQEQAVAAAKTGADPTDEELLASVGTPVLALGAAVFQNNCVACHEQNGQGKIGPNLTDNAWLHGGTPSEIFRTIRDGFAAKGMPAWGPPLGRAGVLQVTAFVLSLRDKNVPGKAPEGVPLGAKAELAPTAGP